MLVYHPALLAADDCGISSIISKPVDSKSVQYLVGQAEGLARRVAVNPQAHPPARCALVDHDTQPTHSIKLDPLVDFELWMTDSERDTVYSHHTIKVYMRVTRVFYDYLSAQGLKGPEDVTTAWVYTYASAMRGNGLADTSIQTYLAALKTFFDYLVDRAVVLENPVTQAQRHYLEKKARQAAVGRGLPVLHHSEEARLISVVSRRRHKNRLRDLAFVGFLLDTGLRIEELAGVTVQQAAKALETGELELVLRGEAPRCIKMLGGYTQTLRDYLQSRDHASVYDLLFTARTGAPISTALAHKLISRYLKEAGIDKGQAGANLLRHTAAYRMLAAGRSEVDVQHALGQATPVSIRLYSG